MAPAACLIVNPSAGGGRAGRLAPEVMEELHALGVPARRCDTRDLLHARELAVDAAGRGETVVALSGDGMVGAIADELRAVPGAVLVVLPGGRGNDLARVLGIPRNARAACAIVAAGESRPVDLGEAVDGSGATCSFVGIASVGFDSEANRIANEAPPWLGPMVYAYGALRAIASWHPARFEIELDPPGERVTFSGYSVGAANSKAYGGGMFAAPDALLDDGLLDIVVLEDVSRLRFLTRVLPRAFNGTLLELPGVHCFRAAEVVISADRPFEMYADGDPIGELPLRLRAVPGAVQMLVPPQSGPRPAFAAPPPPATAAAAD
jgi:YegS/Rv2252/BmrU family lipid kinase